MRDIVQPSTKPRPALQHPPHSLSCHPVLPSAPSQRWSNPPSTYLPRSQALQAINTLNGADLAGRRILVREDREDRDVKPPGAPTGPPPTRSGRGAGRGAGRGGAVGGRGAGRGAAATERTGESSGLQVVVRGIPWSYTWKELKDMFVDLVADVDRADVVYGDDGRSRVSEGMGAGTGGGVGQGASKPRSGGMRMGGSGQGGVCEWRKVSALVEVCGGGPSARLIPR